MEATMTKPRQSYVFDHKLTPEEIQQFVDNHDYDPSIYDNFWEEANLGEHRLE